MKRKIITKLLCKLLFIMTLLLLPGNISFASPMELPSSLSNDSAEPISGMGRITKAAKGYAAPAKDKILAQLEEGQQVVLLGVTADQWYQVLYQENVMYIQGDFLEAVETDEKLQEEMGQLEEERVKEAEEDVAIRKANFRKKTAGIVIVLLIAAIFTVGAVSVLKPQRPAKK